MLEGKTNTMCSTYGSGIQGALRVVAKGLGAVLLLVTVCACGGCTSETQEADVGAAIIEPGTESSVPIVFAVGKTLYRSGPGSQTTTLATVEYEPAGSWGMWIGVSSVFYISPGPGLPELRSVKPEVSEETVLAAGAIIVVNTAENGAYVCLEEDAEMPMAVRRYSSDSDEPTDIAQGVASAMCDPALARFGYVGLLDPNDSTSRVAVMAKSAPEAQSDVLWILEPRQGADVVAVSSERVMFVVYEDATLHEGDLFEYRFDGGDVKLVAEEVGFLAANPSATRLMLARVTGEPDAITVRAVEAVFGEDDEWGLADVGAEVRETELFAEYSDDGNHVLVGHATLGRDDRIRVYGFDEVLAGEMYLDAGTAIGSCMLASDASAVAVVVQELNGSGSLGVERETLQVFDVSTGEITVLASSRLSRGDGMISLVGMPTDLLAWE